MEIQTLQVAGQHALVHTRVAHRERKPSFDGTINDIRNAPAQGKPPHRPPLTWTQTARAALGTSLCQGVGAAMDSAFNITLVQALRQHPAHIALTVGGALAGSITGAYTGAGIGRAICLESPYARHPCARFTATGIGVLAGGCLGALPSLLNREPVNSTAIGELANLGGGLLREAMLQGVSKDLGWRIEKTPTLGSASACTLAYAADLGVVSVLRHCLSTGIPTVETVLAQTLASAMNGATATLVRSFYADARLKEGRNRPVMPNALELINASLLRNAGASLVGAARSVMPALGTHAEGVVFALLAAPAEYRSWVGKHVIHGLTGCTGQYSPEPGAAPAVGVDDSVATTPRRPTGLSFIASSA